MNFLAAAAYQESGLNGVFRQFIDSISCNSRTSNCPPATGVPMQSFDNGYGIMQITNGIPVGLTGGACQSPISPPTLSIPTTNTPTQDMIWNWVSNLNAGASVMVNKYNQEITSENNIIYNLNNQNLGYLWVSPTTEQRQMNVWQRYNGGLYWVWRCANSNGVISLYEDPYSPCMSAPACNPNGTPNSTYFCQWITNTTLQVKKCNSVNPTYNYAQCVEYWANLNPQWCEK